jgi:hypothetical protein
MNNDAISWAERFATEAELNGIDTGLTPKFIMACGHAPSGADKEGCPICAICVGITAKAELRQTVSIPISRQAKCSHCGSYAPSVENLAFYQYKPNEEYDEFYCGCAGWN